MRLACVVLCLALAGCAAGSQTATAPLDAPIAAVSDSAPARLPPRRAIRNFITVIETIEPVAEQVCRDQSPNLNCDFLIVIDDTPGAPPNAFQKVDEGGRPIIIFTLPLIAEARNQDELAFVLAHEAAHHIAGHLQRQQQAAIVGATILGNIAGLSRDPDTVENAIRLGAALGARTYSKEFELQADALGARIALAAGYDPLLGAEFFFRIPDPGDSFLGTHPANADRFRIVQRIAQGA